RERPIRPRTTRSGPSAAPRAHGHSTTVTETRPAQAPPQFVMSAPVPSLRTRLPYRPSLDGLRAVAIIGVLVFHLDATWLPGGWLGVDLFFVLSGFLITSLLVAEQDRWGRIALLRFWGARMRRLLPSLVTVLLAV